MTVGRTLTALLLCIVPMTLIAQIPERYYDSAEGLTGTALKQALHAIIADHTRYPYTAGGTDVWDILMDADEDPDNPDNVILIYTGRSQEKTLNSGQADQPVGDRWNREHIWAKSHGFPSESDTAYTDCHHLKPADESVNSSRGNKDFDEGGTQHSEATECFADADSWEPRDAVKGDVARMMFYMVVRYDPGYHSDETLYDLELVDSTGTPSSEPVFGKLSTLIEWHHQDPVDAFESNRHEIVYGYQGNRNPFIDHPAWVDSIFDPSLNANTQVSFLSATNTVDESSGSIQIPIGIVNADPERPTQAEVQITPLTGSLDDFTMTSPQLLFWGPGESGNQVVSLTIVDDDEPEDAETFLLELLNITGGDSATAGDFATCVLTIAPNDQPGPEGIYISEISDAVGTGNYIYEFIELFNETDSTMDLTGFTLRQANSTQSFTMPDSAIIPAFGFLVVCRDAGQQAFETFWNIQLTEGVVFINSENDIPLINGDEVYLLEDDGGVNIDPPLEDEYTSVAISSGSRIYRMTRGNLPADWGVDDAENATPGSLDPEQTLSLDSALPGYTVAPGPRGHVLQRIYPNPFNPDVTIELGRLDPQVGLVTIRIYGIDGRLVAQPYSGSAAELPTHVRWSGQLLDGHPAPAGVYLVVASGADHREAKRILLLR